MMNSILQGWNRIFHDYRYWKQIIDYPYDAFDCAVLFGNLGQPPTTLVDYIKEWKRFDPDWEKNYYDNLRILYDGIDQQIDETYKLLEEVDEVLK